MKNKYHLVIVSLFIIGCLIYGNGYSFGIAASNAQVETQTEIDTYMQERMRKYKIPGAALAIVKGNQIVYEKGYGFADSSGREITPQTPFMLASLSKSFTALAIMQLAGDNKIDLDAPIQKYLPWFRIADKEATSKITVHQLLYQTSGFSTVDGNKINDNSNMEDDALITLMKKLKKTRLASTPGTTFHYSNINYGLLGAIVESVSHQSFESYIEQKIFTPLDMKHSYTSLADANAGGLSQGFYPFFGVPIKFTQFMLYSRAMTSWGGIFSSAEDMAHYLIAHLNDGRYQDKVILSPEGMGTLHTPGIQLDKYNGYAMGWYVGPDWDLTSKDPADIFSNVTTPITVNHQGAMPAYRTVALMMPQDKVGIVVLMNTNNQEIQSVFGWTGWDILSIYQGIQPASYPPGENFILQHVRTILTVILILLLASFIWFMRKLRSWRQEVIPNSSRWKKLAPYLVIPLAIDVLLAWYVLAVQLPQSDATVRLVLIGAPDIGILIIFLLLLTLGWGAIRTIWMLTMIFRKAPTKVEAVL